MSRKRLALFTAVFTMVMMAVGATSSVAAPSPQTLHFLEVNTSFAGIGGFNISGNAPPAVGQGFTFVSTLFKWAGAKKGAPLGHDQVVCTVTSVDLSSGLVQSQCAATVFLPGGGIQLAGSTNFNKSVTMVAVVGGTGAYAGAQGTARIKTIGGDNSSVGVHAKHHELGQKLEGVGGGGPQSPTPAFPLDSRKGAHEWRPFYCPLLLSEKEQAAGPLGFSGPPPHGGSRRMVYAHELAG